MARSVAVAVEVVRELWELEQLEELEAMEDRGLSP
jgi:hypothetical protein